MSAIAALIVSVSASDASGIMMPSVHQIFGEGCAPISGAGEHPLLPEGRPLRYQGYQRGYTSAPGGPGQGHLFVASPEALSLRRVRCEEQEAGRWITLEAFCDPAPLLRWEGALLPGELYAVMGAGSDLLYFQTAGESAGAACPG